jgi:RNA polymerase sigma factor (sigma-70 family)
MMIERWSTLRNGGWSLRAQSGDREAFDALLAQIGPPLLRYVTRVTGDPALAEDVVQETFIAIVRKISWLNDPSLFRAWAYRIASREAFRLLRKSRRYVEPIEELTFIEQPSDPGSASGSRPRSNSSRRPAAPWSRCTTSRRCRSPKWPRSSISSGHRQIAPVLRPRPTTKGEHRMKVSKRDLILFLVIDFMACLAIVPAVLNK